MNADPRYGLDHIVRKAAATLGRMPHWRLRLSSALIDRHRGTTLRSQMNCFDAKTLPRLRRRSPSKPRQIVGLICAKRRRTC
ncbi:hypothetical protein [Bradyrhizobium sp. STM 3561]|uniref:hypothetical protein n=1 Tax=Bradyrhizobium sp. STM 3561 TaxID=578923 RepID=UPI00388D0939